MVWNQLFGLFSSNYLRTQHWPINAASVDNLWCTWLTVFSSLLAVCDLALHMRAHMTNKHQALLLHRESRSPKSHDPECCRLFVLHGDDINHA